MSAKTKKDRTDISGILLLAKKSGLTSFSSLNVVKKTLGTTKVGHTGTLDSFADGLLVVLSGKLTKLVGHITEFDKSYLAIIEFGTETDTLDPTGTVTAEGKIPGEEEIRSALKKFHGEMEQVPPAFSAVHISGKRASDIARSGKEVIIPSRKIKINSIKLLDFYGKYALIEVFCSKGTYIRSLARDIARECGTVSHLCALRRTSVGPFLLKDAAGKNSLGDFTISEYLKKTGTDYSSSENPEILSEIKENILPMTEKIALACGFSCIHLNEDSDRDFLHGRPLENSYFCESKNENEENRLKDGKNAVFYSENYGGTFAGIIEKKGNALSYGFVIHPEKKYESGESEFPVFSWNDIVSGKFPQKIKNQGTALTVGSFDGPHLGHFALFKACLEKKKTENLIPGVVTFSKSLRGIKNNSESKKYAGDVSVLSQRLKSFSRHGMEFAVVIDFSLDFGKIEGTDFLSILSDSCGMKFLAEGDDFRCGYKGAVDVKAIAGFIEKSHLPFEFNVIDHVDYLGKRVNSSRIRECISSGNFTDVREMLGRKYEIDCSSLEWSEKIEKNRRFFTADIKNSDFIQVLPEDGTYDVDVFISVSEGNSFVKHSVCKLESGELRLLDSDGSLKGFIKAIQFC